MIKINIVKKNKNNILINKILYIVYAMNIVCTIVYINYYVNYMAMLKWF